MLELSLPPRPCSSVKPRVVLEEQLEPPDWLIAVETCWKPSGAWTVLASCVSENPGIMVAVLTWWSQREPSDECYRPAWSMVRPLASSLFSEDLADPVEMLSSKSVKAKRSDANTISSSRCVEEIIRNQNLIHLFFSHVATSFRTT